MGQHTGCYDVTRQVRWPPVRIAPGVPIIKDTFHVLVYDVPKVSISPDISDARRERARGPVAEKFIHDGGSAVIVSP